MSLTDEAARQLRAAVSTRVDAEAALAHARAEEQRVVRLVHLGGASVRQIAQVLGISHQRVQQLIEAVGDGRGWRRKYKPSEDLECSFCGKDRIEVAKLIAGPGVYICDQCVRRARQGFTPQDRCSFCGKASTRHLKVRGVEKVAICKDCLDLCDEIIAEELENSAR